MLNAKSCENHVLICAFFRFDQRFGFVPSVGSAFSLVSVVGVPTDSFVLAVLFGLGTTLSPILLLGGVTGWLLDKAPLFQKWISIVGAGILILLGIITIVNAIIVTTS
jgi:putative Mn2+ efflux pump MntP